MPRWTITASRPNLSFSYYFTLTFLLPLRGLLVSQHAPKARKASEAMPHDYNGGMTTTSNVTITSNVNYSQNNKPPISHSGGQDSANVKTEANDSKKQ